MYTCELKQHGRKNILFLFLFYEVVFTLSVNFYFLQFLVYAFQNINQNALYSETVNWLFTESLIILKLIQSVKAFALTHLAGYCVQFAELSSLVVISLPAVVQSLFVVVVRTILICFIYCWWHLGHWVVIVLNHVFHYSHTIRP